MALASAVIFFLLGPMGRGTRVQCFKKTIDRGCDRFPKARHIAHLLYRSNVQAYREIRGFEPMTVILNGVHTLRGFGNQVVSYDT